MIGDFMEGGILVRVIICMVIKKFLIIFSYIIKCYRKGIKMCIKCLLIIYSFVS